MASKKANNKPKITQIARFQGLINKVKSNYLLEEILGWFFIFLGLFTIVASLNKGGSLGFFYKNFLYKIFGFSYLALIFVFLLLGLGWLFKLRLFWKISSSIALIILFLILTAFSELFFLKGGYLGQLIVTLKIYLGEPGLIIFLIMLSFICLSIILEKPLRDFVYPLIEKLKKRKVKVETYLPTTQKKEKEEKEKKEVKVPEIIKISKATPIKEEIRLKKLPIKSIWELPPLSLLDKTETQAESGDIKENMKLIKTTLENFGINIEIVEVTIGPTVTRYSLKPPEGVKLSKILSLQNDLALALGVKEIRIEAPIPGRSLIGIEVPNIKKALIRLRSLVENPEFLESESLMLIPIGRLITGEPFYADLASMPHLLIAGTTGSGKSVFIHSLLVSLLLKNTPETLNLILIDPKRVELIRYESLPFLLMDPILDPKKVIPVINWLINEMDERYKKFQEVKARDISSYNKTQIQKNKKIMPRILFIIDEMADLMALQGHLIENAIIRLTQMARATGIHLVLATQRPSVDVVTGLIKANIPNRICFKVPSIVDSRTVLDYSGAEKLIGAGDMLFVSSLFGGIKRVQAPFISEKEIDRIVDFWAKQASEKEEFEKEEINLEEFQSLPTLGMEEEEEEDLIKAALQIILETGKASTSLLQRKLKIGYARAARILDILEERGVVGPQEGTKPRKVLIDNIEQIKEDINE